MNVNCVGIMNRKMGGKRSRNKSSMLMNMPNPYRILFADKGRPKASNLPHPESSPLQVLCFPCSIHL